MKLATAMLFGSALVLGACSESATDPELGPAFARNGAQQSVTGHVENDLSQFGIPFEKYSFSAVRQADGAVTGRFQVFTDYQGGAFKLQGEVTCMTIEPDGKTARMGGVVTHSNVPDIQPGDQAAWSVRDNGEGQNAADNASDLVYGYNAQGTAAQDHCAFGLFGPYSTSTKGNVQVRP